MIDTTDPQNYEFDYASEFITYAPVRFSSEREKVCPVHPDFAARCDRCDLLHHMDRLKAVDDEGNFWCVYCAENTNESLKALQAERAIF